MFKHTYLLFFAFFLLAAGCGTTPETPEDEPQTEDTENPAATDEMEATDKTTGSDQYTITVIDPAPKSPRKEMAGMVGETKIAVNYGSPKVKGRIIWGSLEDYDQVWRAGANEATTVEMGTDLMVEGEKLPAGKYAFFLIPREEGSWTAIFNSEAEQWGAAEYDEAKDVLRVEVTPNFVEENKEELDYMLEGNQLILRWAKTEIPLDISAG